MTRKLKTIEHGKTKDPKNTKLDGKATKLVEELKLLKDATKLDMVKKAYLFNQDPDKVLKLHKASAEHRSICRLLMNPFLKDAIAASKKKLDIKEDNEEECKKLVSEVGKNKARKLTREKYEAAAGMPITTALEKKIAAKKARNKEKKAAKKLGLTSSTPKTESPLDDKSKTIDKTVRKEKLDQKKKTQLLKPKPAGAPKAKPATSAPDNSLPEKVNLFPVEAAKDSKKPTKEFREGKKWNKDRPANSFAGKPQSRDNGGYQKPSGGSQKSPGGPQRSSGGFQKPSGGPPVKSGEKLHPSWEAKLLKKPAISEFKGKKTTFDD